MAHINRLSARSVLAAKTGLHCDGLGLYLRVDKAGSKRWIFLFQWRGKRSEMGLGSANTVGLAEARQHAADARKTVAAGINPIVSRKHDRREGVKFGEFADQLIISLSPNWKNAKHLAQWKHSLEVDAKALRDLPLDQVTTDDVVAVLAAIWLTKPETASRCRGRIERVLDAARARGLRVGENPARWKGHLDNLLSAPKKLTRGHHPAMAISNLHDFLAAVRMRKAVSARALELTILTALRTSEVTGARWQEFDLDAALWTVPASRMKRKVEHRVPLSPPALAILVERRNAALAVTGKELDPTAYVFTNPGGKPFSNMAMLMLLRRMNVSDVVVHGFRSTFRDWAGEETDFAREITEQALSHQVGSNVERAYRRGDSLQKRRVLMDAWANFCTPAKLLNEAA